MSKRSALSIAFFLSLLICHASELTEVQARAEGGDPEAQLELGKFYLKGKHVDRNPELAVDWIRKAAEQNFGPAVVSMVYRYEKGEGVEEDLDKAEAWYNKALELGYTRDLKKHKPLEDFATSFAEDDARLRAIDPTDVTCTNYVEWMEAAIKSLDELDRENEIDPWLEELSIIGTNNWKLLHAVAMGYQAATDCHGYRALREEDGDVDERNLWMALRQMDRAYRVMMKDPPPDNEQSLLISAYVLLLIEPGIDEPQRLQVKTIERSVEELTNPAFWDSIAKGIVFFTRPASYEIASSDGEILWWLAGLQDVCIEGQTIPRELQPSLLAMVLSEVMTDFGYPLNEEAIEVRAGLADDEIATWSNGMTHVIQLPKTYAFIPALLSYQDEYPEVASWVLAELFKNRFQLERAAKCYELVGQTDAVRSIRANQGTITDCPPFPAGGEICIDYRYRNGNEAYVSLYKIRVESNLVERLEKGEVLESELDLLLGDPDLFRNSGRLNQTNALEHVASFTLALDPKPDHRDTTRRIDLPGLEGGNYLVRVQMKDGNKAETILNVYDSMLYGYDLVPDATTTNNQLLFLLCDALTGKPLPGQPIDFFLLSGGATRGENYTKIDGALSAVQHMHGTTDSLGCYMLETGLLKRSGKGADEIDDLFGDSGYGQLFVMARNMDGHPVLATSSWSRYCPSPEREPVPFITTERPYYRPGDKLHLKLWSGQTMHPEILEIRRRSREAPLAQIELVPDRFGGADTEIVIPENAPLGDYSIARLGWNYPNTSFRIEEYRTPEFEVSLEQPEAGRFEIRAKYAYGQPAANAKARIRISAYDETSSYWYPKAHYDGLWQSGYWWLGNQFPSQMEKEDSVEYWDGFSTNIETRMDAEGCALVDLADIEGGWEAFDRCGYLNLSATVTDAANKEISEQKGMVNPLKESRLCIWLDKAFFDSAEKIDCHWASKGPVTGVSIELRRIEGTNSIPLRQVEAGASEIELGKLDPGLYELQALAERQCPSQSFRFWVEGADDTQLTPEDPIRIVREKGTYDTSESATILIQVDRPGRWVYFFDHMMGYGRLSRPQPLYMNETSKKIVIPLNGNAGFLQCAAMTVVDGRPHVVSSPLPVADRSVDAGSVAIAPDKMVYLPGEPVRLDIQALDKDGHGKPSAVAVAVYNQMLDTLARPYRPSIYKALFSTWPYYAELSAPRFNDAWPGFISAIAPDWAMEDLSPFSVVMKAEPQFSSFGAAACMEADYFGGGDLLQDSMFAGEGLLGFVDQGGVKGAPLSVRKDFRDTAYWNALVETDARGKASLEFTMPDSLTEWKVVAWAMNTNYAAQGETSIVCKKDFVVQLNTPRFMVEGDELEISGSVRNHADVSMTVDAACSVGGIALQVESPEAKRIENLDPGNEQLCYWNVAATEEGLATVTAAAQSTNAADGMERPIPVLSHSMLKRGARSGVLTGDRREERIAIDIPEAVDADSMQLHVDATPNMLASVASALPYLADYPYGCTEQTLNRFLPSLVVLQTLDQLGVGLDALAMTMPDDRQSVLDRDEIIKRAQAGIDKLENTRDRNGIWGWNPDSSSPRDLMISAWVLRGLNKAAQEGDLKVDITSMKSGMQESIRQLSLLMQPPWRQKSSLKINDTYALMTVVIHEINPFTLTDDNNMDSDEKRIHSTIERSAPYLMKHAHELSFYGKVLLAYAFELRGETGPRDELMVFIDQYLKTDPALGTCRLRMPGNEWWRWYNDPIETLAWYLKLLNRVEPHSAKTAGVARSLMLNRQHGDHWKSTRDTAICVEALCEFIVNHPPTQDGSARILLNGLPLSDGNRLRTGHNELVVASDSGTTLFYDATWQYRTRENPIAAETSDLVSISRAYYRIDSATGERAAKALADDEVIKAGETILVELTLHAAQELEYVLAQDFKPAGFECTETASGYRYADLPHYRELYDERVDCYITHVPKGNSSIVYNVRPEHAGTVSAMPATVELMYAPEQAANAGEAHLKIER